MPTGKYKTKAIGMTGVLEGTGFEVLAPEFEGCFIGHVRVDRIWTGGRWTEGPVWFAAGRYLVWSDIPNNRLMRWDETDGSVSVFREPSNNNNGNTVDTEGRLVSCEHLTRRVTRTDHNGKVSVIADSHNGKRLNSPNDVVVKSDGSVWFTDPNYGILSDYEGERAESDIGACHVYRVDQNGNVDAVVTDMVKPNGLAFSPDEKHLYIADTGRTHDPKGPAHIRKFKITADGKGLSGGDVFSDCSEGLFDGFRLDMDGRIWSSAADGVHCLNTKGNLIGKIRIPEIVSNVCFGGAKLNRLFITATGSLYSVYLDVNGAPPAQRS